MQIDVCDWDNCEERALVSVKVLDGDSTWGGHEYDACYKHLAFSFNKWRLMWDKGLREWKKDQEAG